MSNWMARFKDGPYDGQTRSFPEGKEPPDEVVMVAFPLFGVLSIDGPDYDARMEADSLPPHPPEAVTRYRKVKQSKLPEDDELITSGVMVRGAEYEVVE